MEKVALARIFIFLCFTMLLLLVIWARKGALMANINNAAKNRFFFLTSFSAIAWVAFILILTTNKFFYSFDGLPPRQLLFFAPPLLALILVLRSKNWTEVLKATPLVWLIYVQSFRIVVEAILYSLHLINELPVLMTFEGQNFDIIVGVTAPIVAFLLSNNIISKKLAIMWNYAGIIILGVTVVSAILAMPNKLQVINVGDAMKTVAEMPWTLLPSFLVPLAFYGHALSIKQLRLKKE